MSRSGFHLGLTFSMLEGRKACVPGFEDSSGGHTVFKTTMKTRTVGPGSGVFDEVDEPYDEEKWVAHIAQELATDLTYDDNRFLKSLVRNVFAQAAEHCDELHQDQKERFKKERLAKAKELGVK